MANALKMAIVQSIKQLHAAGWSQRRIARELEIDRGTVARHLRPPPPDPKPAIPPAGFSPSDGSNAATFSPLPAPAPSTSAGDGDADGAAVPNAAIPPAGSEGGNHASTTPTNVRSSLGRPAQCEPFRATILAKLDQRLSAQRIWQDLVVEHGYTGSYDSVKRFVRRLGATTPLPFRRMECAPGLEAQVDFGTGAPVITADGKRRKTHVFRIVLSHSRKGYSEPTFTQTTDDFLRALENAFAHFGGVPQTLVIDNLKAAVLHPDWFDPVLTPKVQSFCQHYGTVILPTKPRMPRHKGKVESGVNYVQSNGLKGRKFGSLEEQQRHLAEWERTVADTRIHGTTKQQVLKVFEEVERPALRVLPQERFANFREAKRKVNRDGHVEVAKAYYSVPPEYLGREVWARWDARLVRIFNCRWEQIAVHVRHEQGRFSTHGQHLVKEKINGLEHGANYLLGKVSAIGEQAHQWAQAMLTARGIEGTRVLQGLLALTKKHSDETLEKACDIALSHGCFRLRTIRQLLQRETAKQEPLPFLDEHPLIRPLDDYAAIVARAIHRQAGRSSMSEGFDRHDRTKTKSLTASSQSGSSSRKPADLFPPGSGYPSSGCTSAEPGSVSPDSSTVVPPSSFDQEQSDE
ncbi:MAG TPA: IS21 family transposase [Candidatus Binatia bacterium]|nr:IS21 family transposase [Candidatus Binatia bacterium]